MAKRKICPACGLREVAINCHRRGKTYYRSRCDQCIRAGRQAKASVPGWVRSGYKKKDRCERCGFKVKVAEQASVVYADGNEENNDWLNIKTVCANCRIELAHTPFSVSRKGPEPD